jgi:hypothetical protein
MVRGYALGMGLVIVLLGVGGLVQGEQPLFGVLNIDFVEDLVHLLTGGLMVYVGLARRDAEPVRLVVGAVGVVYILVGVLGFVVPTLFGLLPHGYSVFDNVIHLVLGALGVLVARSGRRPTITV